MTQEQHSAAIAPYLADERLLLALCVYREARGECLDAKRGVAWTVRNRCSMAPREGFKHDIGGNVLKPWAFSSFNSNDPNYFVFPQEAESAWLDCLAAADSDSLDPTGGAVFYFSAPLKYPPHSWGSVSSTADIGGLHFYAIGKVSAVTT